MADYTPRLKKDYEDRIVKAMTENRPINVYNHGKMSRDFTFIDDLVDSVVRLADVPPSASVGAFDSLSPVAPFRTVNIGKAEPDPLLDFIAAFETALGIKAQMKMMDMQPGDVPATWSDTTLLKALVGKSPTTPLSVGVPKFVDWYKTYYGLGEA